MRPFVFQHSAFWQLLAIFDTAAMLGTLAVFSLMGPAVAPDRLLLVAMGMTYIVGTLQWYYVGGGLGRFSRSLGRIEDRRRRRRMVSVGGNFEIGRFLHLKSPKSWRMLQN